MKWTSSVLALWLAAACTWAVAQPSAPAAPEAVAAPVVQSANILQWGPDADRAQGYAGQSNAERARVQPGNNAPLWRAVGQGAAGYSSLPAESAPEAGVLIQPFVQYPGSRVTNAGQAWREVRNHWILPYMGSLLLISLLALVLVYFTKGPLGHDHSHERKRIERFTPFERAAHWVNAGAFVALALSGLTMAFGKFILLPVIGSTLFGWLSFALKNLHNFVGPLFAVSLAIIIVTFVKDNIANAADFNWLKTLGGMLSKHQEVPSHRFNAAEKGVFWWAITLPGVVVVATGLILDKLIPGLGGLRADMQLAHMIHSVLALWMVAVLIGHIYMGTIGTRGAYEGMASGYVTEGWAQEHHQLWYEDVRAGKIPVQRSSCAASAATSPVAQTH